MQLQVIDFHARFMQDYMQWCQENEELAKDEEHLEERFYDLYDTWMQSPKEWLEGKSPLQYFHEIGDARLYVSAMIEYILEEVELPDPLLHCILERKEEIYPIFLGILYADNLEEKDVTPEQLLEIQGHIVSLLEQMQMPHPYEQYLNILRDLQEDSLFAEEATAALAEAGEQVREQVFEAYAVAQGYAKKCLLDLIAYYSGDARALEILLEEFAAPEADLAFLAECLGRLGDEGALDSLRAAIADDGIEYYEFRELRNAIEAIGGEEIPDRDFSGDALYDYLAAAQEENGAV